jgi:uracil-DNA glycosylase family 4
MSGIWSVEKYAKVYLNNQSFSLLFAQARKFLTFSDQHPVHQLAQLQKTIVACTQCPRLVSWRDRTAKEKVARFKEWKYWGKPVPGFGDPKARLLIVGLAPGAHGANRTGRMFTGDRSGDWLYGALWKAGFAQQPTSVAVDDGQELTDCYITAAVRCVPPDNKPTREEASRCRSFLVEEIELLKSVKVILALGGMAWQTVYALMGGFGIETVSPKVPFAHGATAQLGDRYVLIGSYHPSQQNTFTGRLTEKMLNDVFNKVKRTLRKQ